MQLLAQKAGKGDEFQSRRIVEVYAERIWCAWFAVVGSIARRRPVKSNLEYKQSHNRPQPMRMERLPGATEELAPQASLETCPSALVLQPSAHRVTIPSD